MMKCREYVFRLTSEQFAHAVWPVRFSAGLHRLMCVNCRRFTANDAQLTTLATRYRRWLDEGEGAQESGHPTAGRPPDAG